MSRIFHKLKKRMFNKLVLTTIAKFSGPIRFLSLYFCTLQYNNNKAVRKTSKFAIIRQNPYHFAWFPWKTFISISPHQSVSPSATKFSWITEKRLQVATKIYLHLFCSSMFSNKTFSSSSLPFLSLWTVMSSECCWSLWNMRYSVISEYQLLGKRILGTFQTGPTVRVGEKQQCRKAGTGSLLFGLAGHGLLQPVSWPLGLVGITIKLMRTAGPCRGSIE